MHVLVSGAGIAGPALAWWLAKVNIRVTIVEKASELLTTGQNIDIDGTARKVIRRMGLADEVRRLNTTEIGCRLIDPKGRPIAPFPMKEGLQVSATSELEILRADLAKILFNAAKDLPGVEFLFGTTIEKVLRNDENSVEVALSNGRVQTYDVLVAADGQWSQTRKRCFPSDVVTIKDMNMIAIYGTVPRMPADDNWWNIYQSLNRRCITTRPDPHGTIRATFTRMPLNEANRHEWHEAARADRETQVDLLQREFADAGWEAQRILDALNKSPDFYFHAIQQIRMSRWSEGRVVCLGDAAYAPSPLSGGGTPLALLGAYVLAGELSKLQPDQHPSAAFKAYETQYRSHVDEVQDISPTIPRIAHPKTKFQRWLFQLVMKTISRIIAISWVANRLKESEEDYKLPMYPAFDNVEEAKSAPTNDPSPKSS